MVFLEGLVPCLFGMLHSLLFPLDSNFADSTPQCEVASVGVLLRLMSLQTKK